MIYWFKGRDILASSVEWLKSTAARDVQYR
jgi:hypothetical protein